MAKRVEGLSIDLDLNTQALNRGLKGAKDQLKTTGSEMKATMSAFDRGDRSVEKYERRLQGLNKKLQAQEKVTSEARKEYDRMVEQHGEGSKEAEKAAREYNNQAAALNNLDRYVNDATQELENMREEQERANSKWGNLSSNLDNFAGQLDTAQGKMNEFGDTMSSRVTAPIVGMGALAVESTRDFREQMARLETNAKDAGVGIDTTREAMRDLSGVSKETDSNVEALSNLLATDMNESQMQQTIDNLSGAIVKFPDTLKIESLADGLQETVSTGKAMGPFAELLERMGVDIETFEEGLAEAKEDGDELNYTLDTLNDLDLSKMNKEFRDSNQELVEHREAQYDFQESFAELGEKLEPIATDITERVIDIVEAFNDLEPATQNNIIKFAGLAAAVGPASKVLGGLTGGVKNTTRLGSKLASTLGKKGGTGLVGKLGMLGKGGVVGLAIGGVTALGIGVHSLMKDTEELNDVSLENANKLDKQYESNKKMIESLSELREKSNLTNDEFARYVDLSSELESASDPKVIEDIKAEMEKLKKQSGFSNEELNTMVQLNGDLAEALPGATEEVTKQGKKIIGTREEMEKYNQEIRDLATTEMEKEFYESLENQEQLFKKREEHQKSLERYQERANYAQQLLNQYSAEELEIEKEQLWNEIESLQGKKASARVGSEEWRTLHDQLEPMERKYQYIKDGYSGLLGQLTAYKQQIASEEESLLNNEKKINQTSQIMSDLESQYLTEAGITEEKARQAVRNDNALGFLDSELQKLRDNKTELLNKKEAGELTTKEYKDQVGELDDQILNLQDSKERIQDLQGDAEHYTDILGRDITSRVDFEPDGSDVYAMRAKFFEPVYTPLHFDPNLSGLPPLYADGIESHPGGPAIVGEEGWELARHGNQWSALNAGMYDLPRGTEIFTHGESKRMIEAMNNIPAYASGISAPSEADRIINSLGDHGQQREVIGLLREISNGLKAGQSIYMDGREVGRQTFDHISEFFDREKRIEEQFR